MRLGIVYNGEADHGIGEEFTMSSLYSFGKKKKLSTGKSQARVQRAEKPGYVDGKYFVDYVEG